MQYRTLFSLTIRHDYYESGECPDFTVGPTPECARLLQGYRLLGRPGPAGYRVLTSVNPNDATKPFFPLPQGLTFSFLLYLNNPAFVNFTDLDASYRRNLSGKPVLFVNENFQSQTDAFDLKNDGKQVGAEKHFILSKKPRPGAGTGTGDTDIRLTQSLSNQTGTKSISLAGFDADTNTIRINPNTVQTGIFEVRYPLIPNTLVARDGSQHTDHFNLEDRPLANGKRSFVLSENLKPGAVPADILLDNPALMLTEIDPEKNAIAVLANGIDKGPFSVSYPVSAQLPQGCFARVDIRIIDPAGFSNITQDNPGNRFHIDFHATSFYWKCCAVAPAENKNKKKSVDFFDTDSNKVRYQQLDRTAETRIEIFDDFAVKLATQQEGEKKTELKDFQSGVVDLEARSALGNYKTRFFIFSDRKIPCREKYAALPTIKVNIQDSDPKKDYNFLLTAPPDAVDVIRIIPIE